MADLSCGETGVVKAKANPTGDPSAMPWVVTVRHMGTPPRSRTPRHTITHHIHNTHVRGVSYPGSPLTRWETTHASL